MKVTHTIRGRADYFIPSEHHLLVILVLHNIVGKLHIQEKHYEEIILLRERCDRSALLDVLEHCGIANIGMEIVDNIELYHSNCTLVARARTRILDSLSSRDRWQRWRVGYVRFKRFARRFSFRTKAPLYVFLGVDGVGKSTVCNLLADSWNRSGIFRAVVQYMGP